MAYSGDPILVEDLLFRPDHSLIDQSLHSHMGETTTNGDGFGIGWYGEGSTPALFKCIEPAWNQRNLEEISSQIRTPLLFAHVRASTGAEVQRSNCHPFRYNDWMWMHNGLINGYFEMKRDLAMAVDPSLYSAIEGSTDSEMLFFLALTFGLEDDPFTAVARTVGFVEDIGGRRGITDPVQATIATTDGDSVWVFRYSTEQRTRSLFYSTKIEKVRALYPEVEAFRRYGDDTRFVVSEPLRDLEGLWQEVPESYAGVVRAGADDFRPFHPIAP
jgi:predicted glutamine amidotransferase